MSKLVTLHISPNKLKEYEDVFLLQPLPTKTPNSSLIKPSIKKIIIKKSQSTKISSPIPTSVSDLDTPRSETPMTLAGSKGRSMMAASANGGLLDLDKSGKPCKKWVKKNKIFRSFTGYPINVKIFKEDLRRTKLEKV